MHGLNRQWSFIYTLFKTTVETLEKEIVEDETKKSNHIFNGFKEESKEFDPLNQEEVPKVFNIFYKHFLVLKINR